MSGQIKSRNKNFAQLSCDTFGDATIVFGSFGTQNSMVTLILKFVPRQEE